MIPRAALCLYLVICAIMPAHAQTWADRKCALYERALADALRLWGQEGIGQAFLDGNAAFIAQGCTERGRICPTTPQQRALADRLTMMTMNEGMVSTFVPFACPE